MRPFEKKNQIKKANILAEQRYLESKGLINEVGNTVVKGIDDEAMDFLRTVKSIKPELYDKYINVIKRKGLEVAVNDFHKYTEQGKAEIKQSERDVKKQDRLDGEINDFKDVLSMVSDDDMAKYMLEFRTRLLNGEKINNGVKNNRFSGPYLPFLVAAYIKANNLDYNLLSTINIFKDDVLLVFDEVFDNIRRNSRLNKLFERLFYQKFGKIISHYL